MPMLQRCLDWYRVVMHSGVCTKNIQIHVYLSVLHTRTYLLSIGTPVATSYTSAWGITDILRF